MLALAELIKPTHRTTIFDVGSNPVDGEQPYRRMLEEGLCDIVGFEPLKDAFERLQAKAGPHETYHNVAVGSGDVEMFYTRRAQSMSGFLNIDPEAANIFPVIAEWGAEVSRELMPTASLDDFAPPKPDFLRMDVQGYELDVIDGAKTALNQCVAIMLEVSFVPLYVAQPTFGEVDEYLRLLGYLPHCFVEAKTWPLGTEAVGPPHQMLEADMLYVRDCRQALRMSIEQWQQLALLAHHAFGSLDLAMHCIQMLVARDALPPDAPQQYRKILAEQVL